MRLEIEDGIGAASLTAAIADFAAAHDRDGSFPKEAFGELSNRGLVSTPPVGIGEMRHLLALLVAVGEGDLSAGRIFEGHVNAVWLVKRFAKGAALDAAISALDGGAVLGVWNTDAPDAPLRLVNDILDGKKNFASGADGLTHAIVTVTQSEGRRMLLVPLTGLPIDRSWWNPVGMRSSGSHVVDFTGFQIGDVHRIGTSDDYVQQPWFSAGAIRFLAVQTGGMKAILSIALDHLKTSGRAENPYQGHRIARMAGAVETALLWLERCAELWKSAERQPSPQSFAQLQAAANGARGVVESLAMRLLDDAEQAIGAAGMNAPHRFERVMRDMRMYLRQPNPDGAAMAFGAAVAEGDWNLTTLDGSR